MVLTGSEQVHGSCSPRGLPRKRFRFTPACRLHRQWSHFTPACRLHRLLPLMCSACLPGEGGEKAPGSVPRPHRGRFLTINLSLTQHSLESISSPCLRDFSSTKKFLNLNYQQGFPAGSVVKNPPANAGDAGDEGSIWLGRFPGEGNGNPLQYCYLENPMHREAWRTIVHRASKSRT